MRRITNNISAEKIHKVANLKLVSVFKRVWQNCLNPHILKIFKYFISENLRNFTEINGYQKSKWIIIRIEYFLGSYHSKLTRNQKSTTFFIENITRNFRKSEIYFYSNVLVFPLNEGAGGNDIGEHRTRYGWVRRGYWRASQ